MVNYNKLLKKLEEKGINSYVIRKKGLIPHLQNLKCVLGHLKK